jgi:hypothetical protein
MDAQGAIPAPDRVICSTARMPAVSGLPLRSCGANQYLAIVYKISAPASTEPQNVPLILLCRARRR